ncbi:CHASE3 domain-containing protein [Allosphingosinicella vermicomposti]|uniref:CHASE3 domain-containing protein n=1 Tax=Allosphingosinicella vermicomposti TaxID=614671 RepID=UPI000D0F782D|nr:CHASE3 domain-containing protein [Allosphingosinicella vermicomposti]
MSRSVASSRVKRRGLGWPVLIGIGAIPVALIILGLLLAQEFRQVRELRQTAIQSYQSRFQINDLLSLMQDVETGQRGYLLTEDPSYLQPYQTARGRLRDGLSALDDEARSRPAISPLVERLRALAAQKVAFADEAIRLGQQGQRSAAIAHVRSGRGKMLMDDIRTQIQRMDDAEKNWLAAASDRADGARYRTQLMTFGILALLSLSLTVAAIMIARTMAARRRALDRLEDTSARQQAILDSARDAIITLNPSGSVETANRAAEAMFGYRTDELVRRDVGVLFEVAPDQGASQSFLQRLGVAPDSARHSEEYWARRSDGGTFPTDVSISPMKLADGTHFVAIVRDITERRQVEQMKSEFVSTVSHELRTPLTSIAGSLGLLSGGAAGALPDKAARLIEIAHSNSERLVRLINDILDIEKIESGKMEFDVRPILLQPLLRQAVQANQGYADSFGVQLALEPGDEGAKVLADPDRLMQVVTNLVSNAIKFSPKGEVVRLSTAPLDRRYRVTVEDRGDGIPEAFRARIFSKFAQADSSDARQKGGTGLGLSIVREIVSRLRGSVSFDTVEGEGTVFHVDLPCGTDGALPRRAEQRILICDSDAACAAQIEEALGEVGFACDIVDSADALHARLEEQRYAAIILDLLLPDEDGIGLIRSLRADPRHAATPIIVVSTHEDDVEGEISQALSVVDWLQKPLPLDRLIARVRDVLDLGANGQPRILHVDDDPDVLNIVATAFDRRAIVHSVPGLETARAALAKDDFDLVILDLGLADGSGLELLPDLRRDDGKPIPIVIFSAQDADPRLAREVDAVLTKSRASLGRLVDTVEVLVTAPPGDASRRTG